MQIEEKYRKDYDSALDKLRGERTRFAEKLSKLPGVRVFPSKANYLMVELTGNGSKENGSILIKKGDIKLVSISFDELSKIKIISRNLILLTIRHKN